jgi:hypothetical protein
LEKVFKIIENVGFFLVYPKFMTILITCGLLFPKFSKKLNIGIYQKNALKEGLNRHKENNILI